jgi:thiol-disulfide isomerase/thioredoxin
MRIFVLVLILTVSCSTYAVESRMIDTREGEVAYQYYPANGGKLFIWVAPEAGLQKSEQLAAEQLASKGIEVWYPNLFEANFLPVVQSSMDRIPDVQIADTLSAAVSTGKQVYFVTSGRGVVPVLRGIRRWQQDNSTSTQFHGLIMLSAKLFVETPDPGKAAELMAIAQASNVPIYWLQPDKSPWFWKLAITVPALQQGGSHVFVQRLRNVRDRFYYRPDATAYENKLATTLPDLLLNASGMLDTQVHVRRPVEISVPKRNVVEGKKDRVLKVYQGDPTPPPLRLVGLDGVQHDLADLEGKVVLVNFWATWCPPCVHEMPSMQRLQDSYKGKAFTILGINMAEDAATIDKFLKEKVSVDFPIWLDSDGKALRDWNVFAFPTSYVIDKNGNIRFALFGSREWDQMDIIKVIDGLVAE